MGVSVAWEFRMDGIGGLVSRGLCRRGGSRGLCRPRGGGGLEGGRRNDMAFRKAEKSDIGIRICESCTIYCV